MQWNEGSGRFSLDLGPPASTGSCMKKPSPTLKRIAADEVRYIRLGKRGGPWEQLSLDRGELHFGYGGISHAMALAGDVDAIVRRGMARGRDPKTAAEDARQVLDFYQLGSDCLWITIARDHLWWAFAKPKVTWLGGGGREHGERIRKTIGGWCNTDIGGVPLKTDALSTRLTAVAAYRRTICNVGPKDYLLRRINGTVDPLIQRGEEARSALLGVISKAIKNLHWEDFEVLVDVIFRAAGGTERPHSAGGRPWSTSFSSSRRPARRPPCRSSPGPIRPS